MILKKTKFWVLIFLTIGISSCSRQECEAFKLEHHVMQFTPFPELEDSYIFTDGNQEITLVKEEARKDNDDSKKTCGLFSTNCTCIRNLNVEYVQENGDITIKYDAVYDGFEDNRSSITYYINKGKTAFDVNQDSVAPQFTDSYIAHEIQASTTLNGVEYAGLGSYVVEHNADSTKVLQQFWIKKNEGIKGFIWDDKIWSIKQ